MAKKKKWKKKLGKALMAGAALAGGLALARRGKATPYRNVHETGAITQTPGRETWDPGVGAPYHQPKSRVDHGFMKSISPGLAYGQQWYGAKGGRVKGVGKAKRGFGRALKKGK